jgi:hypothetical protein
LGLLLLNVADDDGLKKRKINVTPCYRKDDGDDGYWHWGCVSRSAYLEERIFYFLTAFINEKK